MTIERCTFILSGATSSPDDQMYAWGLFSTPVYDIDHNIQGCIRYPASTHLGTAVKTSQAFGILANIIMAFIFLALMAVQFFLEHGAKNVYHVISVLLPCGFCCQLLTFASFASKFCTEILDPEDPEGGTMPATCVPGGAGVCAIFNLVAMILLTVLMKMLNPPDHPVFQLYGTGNPMLRAIYPTPTHALKDINKKKKKKKKQPINQHYAYTPSSQQQQRLRQKRRALREQERERQQRHSTRDSRPHHGRSRGRGEASGPMETFSLMEPQRPGKDKVKTTIVNGPNVRKTIKEITHPDGSQTITTTVEELQPLECYQNEYEEEEALDLEMDMDEEDEDEDVCSTSLECDYDDDDDTTAPVLDVL